MAFLSFTNSSTNGGVNTAQVVNTANIVSTASTQVNAAFSTNIDNFSDAVICAFLASQPNSPQLAHEDLEQIHPDDMEEMNLRWRMAMLTIRSRRFLKKIGRKLTVNGNETLGFDMSKVECYNCHKRGHSARECRALRNQDNKHKDRTRRSVHVETPASIALVSCDGLGGYDWSDQAEERPNYALMAYTSSSSDSKTHPCAKKNIVPRAVLMKSDLVSVNTARQVNVVHSKTIVNAARPRSKNGHIVRPKAVVNVVKGNLLMLLRPQLVSKAFRVFNSRTRIVEENLHIRFSENTPNVVGSGPDWLFDIDALIRTMNYEPIVACAQFNGFTGKKASDNAGQARKETQPVKDYILLPLWTADPPFSQNAKIVNVASTNEGNKLPIDPNMPALEDFSIFNFSNDDEDDYIVADMNNMDTTIQVSPILTTRTHKDHHLDQVIRDLHSITQTRNMTKNFEEHRNKKDKRGIVIRNKARLVAQGHTQEEGIDYDKVFAHVARIEAIRLFLAYASFKDFVVYHMDVKSAFLNGKIEEEVYVCQPPGFKDPDFPDRVYKVAKALYELHQAPRACQDKCVAEILKKFGFTEVKNASTPMETQKPLLKDEDGEEVDVHMYRSMIGSLMYLTSSRLDIMFAFWSTAMAKTINEEAKIHAWDQHLKDFSAHKRIYIAPSHTEKVFSNMRRVGKDEDIYKELDDYMVTAATTASSLEAEQDIGAKNPWGIPLLRLGLRLYLNIPMIHCSQETKTTQALEITSLKRRAKELEKKQRSRTHKLKILYKVGLTAKVDSSEDEQSLGEDASKLERKINDIDADEDITLVNDQDDAEMFDVNYLHVKKVFVKKEVVDKELNDEVQKVVEEVVEDINTTNLIVDDAAQVSTTGKVNVAGIVTTVSAVAIITTEEITLAEALVEIKISKPKAKGIVLQEPSESITTTTISSKKSQEKSKAIMTEEPMKPKKKDQVRLDEEVALKLQAEFAEEERLAKEREISKRIRSQHFFD
uniref:Retrovirus-related Pol polyprotein from transposon TNT 1-94 n=1 Tax=Tanacetum cinerariifolium TaxID=118510 RepID=A0A6L2N7Q1_TANCI|nr:retrovirus-related Pol polyprotein from transposon TNT 1-94 [Tanacetum cinerariifolium]